MKYTLDQLKAMNDDQLYAAWANGDYPFDRAACGYCLTQHDIGFCRKHVGLIPSMRLAMPTFPSPYLRGNLEELYALRIFHDALYPQTVEIHKNSQEVEINLEQGATL